MNPPSPPPPPTPQSTPSGSGSSSPPPPPPPPPPGPPPPPPPGPPPPPPPGPPPPPPPPGPPPPPPPGPPPPPPGPLTDTWTFPGSGNANTAPDWSAGVPAAQDLVVITELGAGTSNPFTVTVDHTVPVSGPIGGLTVGQGVTIAVVSDLNGNGNLAVTGTVDIAGTVQVNSVNDPIVTFALAGVTVDAGGKIETTGKQAFVVLQGDTVTNHGTIVADHSDGHTVNIEFNFAQNGSQFIGNILDNWGNITATSGGGMLIEATELTNEVGATIEADCGGFLEIFSGGPVEDVNLGTIKAAAGGTVILSDVPINNAGGTIEAIGSGAVVQLFDADIQGGTLHTSGPGSSGSSIVVEPETIPGNFSEFDGSAHAVTVDGYVGVFAGAQLELAGTININGSNGQIDVAGPDNNSSTTPGNILINGLVTLSTDGASENPELTLGTSNAAPGQILAASGGTNDTLHNNVWISGAGQIGQGDGKLTIVNEAGGEIQANAGPSASGATLTIDLDNTLTNLNQLQAGPGATLAIENTTVDNTAGSITVDSGAYLTLSGATLEGGTISNYNTTTVVGSSTINGNADLSYGGLTVASGQTLTLDDATLTGTRTTNYGTLHVDGGDTLTLAGGSISGGAIDLAQRSEAIQSISEISVAGKYSFAPVMSGDGQYIVFQASTTLPGPDSITNDIELYHAGHVTDISALAPTGGTFNGTPSISDSGTYVVFEGDYPVQDQNYSSGTIFLYNTQTQALTQVATNAYQPVISGNGQFIAMEAPVQDGQYTNEGMVVTDRSGTVLTTIGGDPNYNPGQGTQPFGNVGQVNNPAISSTGQFVSFWTTSSKVVINGTTVNTGNTAGTAQVYVFDRTHNTLQMVSVNNQGQEGNNDSGAVTLANDHGHDPSSLSADGRYVVFESSATNLVAGSGSGAEQNGVSSPVFSGASNVYLYDTQTHTIELVSAGLAGAAANGASYFPVLSADGNYVTFDSTASNLVAGGAGGQAQTYVYDIQTGTIQLVSATTGGTPGNQEDDLGSDVSDNGSIIAFGGAATNLVSPTTNTGFSNIFVDDLNQTPAAVLDVTANAKISGGATLTGGTVAIASGVTLALDDVTLNNVAINIIGNGTTPSIQVDAGHTLTFANGDSIGGSGALIYDNNGHIVYTGILSIDFAAVTFEGSGTVTRDGGSVTNPTNVTLTNEGNTFDGYGSQGNATSTLTNESAGTFDADFSGKTYALSFGHITNAGTLEATNNGELSVDSIVDNSSGSGGSVVASGGFVDFELGIHGGSATISDGGKLEFGWSSNVNTTFDGAGTLVLDHQVQSDPNYSTAHYTGAVSGFGSNDTLDLTDFGSHAATDSFTTSTSYDGTDTTLTVTDTTQDTSASVTLVGNYTSADNVAWSIASDGHGGVDATESSTITSFSGGTVNSNGVYTPQISNDGQTLELTNSNLSEAASWFNNAKVSIDSFTALFDYQATPAGGGLADGFAFILQDDPRGTSALGAAGSALGYSSDPVNNPNIPGISPSAAVEFNLYSSHTQGTNFVTDDTAGNYNPTGTVDFWDTGDTIQVGLTYDGSVLTETLTDLVNGHTYSTSYDNVDLAQVLGADTAYVGFSAATGGGDSTQTVSDFNFVAGSPPPAPVLTVPGAQTITAGQATAIPDVSLAETGAVNGEIFTVTLTDSTGDLSAGTVGDGDTVTASGTTLTITGSLSDVNSDLGTLTDSDGTTGSDTIFLNATDSFGGNALQQTIDVTVQSSGPTPPNEPFAWATNSSGTWSDSSNWNNNGYAPGDFDNSDQVGINVSGTIIVTLDTEVTIDNLNTSQSVTLDITLIGGLTLSGPDSSDLAGTLNNNGGLSIQGSTLTLGGGGSNSADMTVSASGTLLINANIDNTGGVIEAQADTNSTIQIAGGATITKGELSIGEGDILYVEGAGATLDNVDLENSGTVQVDSGDAVVDLVLSDGTVVDGSLSIGGSGEAEIVSGEHGSGATFENGTVNDSGALQIDSGATLALVGLTIDAIGSTIDNAGSITFDATSKLLVDTSTLQLTGGGVVTLAAGSQLTEDPSNQFVTSGTAVSLDNVDNTISGAGRIGNGDDLLTVTNEAGGTIDANVSGATLTIDTVGSNSQPGLTNRGVLEAENGGELAVHSWVQNTLNDSGGTVVASGGFIDFELGISGGRAMVSAGGKLQYGWSSDVNTTFNGAGTLVLDHQDQQDPNFNVASYSGTVSGFGTGDTLDLTDLAYSSNDHATWVQNGVGGTLTITDSADPQQTAVIDLTGTYNTANFVLTHDNGSGTDVAFKSPEFWGELRYPAVVQGEHQFGVGPQFDSLVGVVALAYTDTINFTTDATSFTATRNFEGLDPFFLPRSDAPQTFPTTTGVAQAPSRNFFILPNINLSGTIEPEGIYVFKGQVNSDGSFDTDGTGANALWQVIGTPDSNSGISLGTPTRIGDASTTGETNYNLTESFKNNTSTPATATSYSVAWDQYNTTNNHYSLDLQITAIDPTTGVFGTPVIFSPVITETGGLTSVTAAVTALPAWQFRAAGGSGVAYALAVAETDTSVHSNLNLLGSHDAIHFQAYSATGTIAGLPSFVIQPNLTAYASGATNEIVQPIIPGLSAYPGQAAQALQFVQVSSTNAGDYAVAWNETVTTASGTILGDQVEFAVATSSGSIVSGSRSTFQIADGEAQNVRIGEFTDAFNSSRDDVVVVYGDDTGTHIEEYGVTATGTTVTLLDSFTDPSAQAFDNLTIMGDGRIAIVYDDLVNPSPDQTSQYDFKLFDLRTQGLSETLGNSQDNYIAGTHFTDTVTGGNGVDNEYYFVGVDTSGTGPADTFKGGTLTGGPNHGWNTAIFADDASNYTITQGSGAFTGGYVITSNGNDPAHSGSLTVDANVQVLAFNPAQDPGPVGNGTLEATGDTMMVLHDFFNDATIAAGSTLEFVAGASSGTVTFDAATGELRLDQPGEFTDTIAGINGNGDVLHLAVYNATGTTATTGPGSFDSVHDTTTLTVSDPGQNLSATYTLAGDYSGSTWTVTQAFGGVDIADPPAPSASANPAVDSSAAANDVNGSITLADDNSADTHTASFIADGSNYLGSFTLDQPNESNGHLSVDFDFMSNNDQINLAPGQTLTQSYNVTVADAQNSAATQSQTVSVTIGGPGNDNFVFAPGVGADTITNFNPQQDTLELDHFANVQTLQELQSFITTDAHGDALINLGHNDSIVLAGVTTAQMTQVIQAGHVLLH